MSVNERKVEFLKVWYAVFCTVMDAWHDKEYTEAEAMIKLRDLRNSLTTRMPEVEAGMLELQRARQKAQSRYAIYWKIDGVRFDAETNEGFTTRDEAIAELGRVIEETLALQGKLEVREIGAKKS